jgi:hypothetical protein
MVLVCIGEALSGGLRMNDGERKRKEKRDLNDMSVLLNKWD